METIIKILIIGCLYYFVATPIFLAIGQISQPLLIGILLLGIFILSFPSLINFIYKK